jgi:hypothetical protein
MYDLPPLFNQVHQNLQTNLLIQIIYQENRRLKFELLSSNEGTK